jgi:hypothetical protein
VRGDGLRSACVDRHYHPHTLIFFGPNADFLEDVKTIIDQGDIRNVKTVACHYPEIMSEKTSIKSLIVAEKIRLNDAIAAYNNLMADLVSGKAVYEVLSDRAIERRLMACKARILSLVQTRWREGYS